MTDQLREAFRALADDIPLTTQPPTAAYAAWSRGRRRRRREQVGSAVAVAAAVALLLWLISPPSHPSAQPPAHPAGSDAPRTIPERIVKDERDWRDLRRNVAGRPRVSAVVSGSGGQLYGVLPDGTTGAIPGVSGDPTESASATALSPDGAHLAGYTTTTPNVFAIAELDGAHPTTWSDVHATGTLDHGRWWAGHRLSWSPDSDRVATCATPNGSDGTVPADLVIAEPGGVEAIPQVCDEVVGWLDPATVVVVRAEAGNTELPDPSSGATLVFAAVSLTEGDTRLLEVHGLTADDVADGPVPADVLLSPDGTRVATVLGADRHVVVLSVDGTKVREEWAPVPSGGTGVPGPVEWSRTGLWMSDVESGALVVSRVGREATQRSIVVDPRFEASSITVTGQLLDAPRTRVAPWGTSTLAASWVPLRVVGMIVSAIVSVLGVVGLTVVLRRRRRPLLTLRSP